MRAGSARGNNRSVSSSDEACSRSKREATYKDPIWFELGR